MSRNDEMHVPEEYLRLAREYERKERRSKQNSSKGKQIASTKVDSAGESLPGSHIVDHASSPLAPLPEFVLKSQEPDLEFSDSESDMEYEDVDVDGESDAEAEVTAGPVEFALEAPTTKRVVRYPRSERLSIHFACLISLALHARVRNSWTCAAGSRKALRDFLPTAICAELDPPAHISGFLRTKRLLEGLRHAAVIWRKRFAIVDIGLYSVPWHAIDDPGRAVAPRLSKLEFFAQLENLKGSVDVFGQGFCALLRTQGLRCRLVSSLQPPDWTSPGRNMQSTSCPGIGKVSTIPTFWTEVWSLEEHRWIVVDPLTLTISISRSAAITSLEPPQTDQFNILRYCLAWSSSGTARDVTRRYTSKYNARTRKKRVSYAGQMWEQFYNMFLSRIAIIPTMPDDVAEIKQLAIQEESEGFPKSAQGFLGHPLYALKSQLKQHQFIVPGAKQIGTTIIRDKVVGVYTRNDVRESKSAAQWWRLGKVPRPGASARMTRKATDRQSGEKVDVDLFAEMDVTDYIPQPVENGIVPKSDYRTVDIYTNTMIPAGAVHIKGQFAAKAARIAGVDYANAVVNVAFKAGAPTSRYDGIVVAQEFKEAVAAIALALQEDAVELAAEEENLRLLLLWRKFIIANRIRTRIDDMNPDRDPVEPKSSTSVKPAISLEKEQSPTPIRLKAPQAAPITGNPNATVSEYQEPRMGSRKRKHGYSIPVSQIYEVEQPLPYWKSGAEPVGPYLTTEEQPESNATIPNAPPTLKEEGEMVSDKSSDDSFPECFLDESDDYNE